jgi:hypothetical protein
MLLSLLALMAGRKNYLAPAVQRSRLTGLRNVAAYGCRHSRKRIGIMSLLCSGLRLVDPVQAGKSVAETCANRLAQLPQLCRPRRRPAGGLVAETNVSATNVLGTWIA